MLLQVRAAAFIERLKFQVQLHLLLSPLSETERGRDALADLSGRAVQQRERDPGIRVKLKVQGSGSAGHRAGTGF